MKFEFSLILSVDNVSDEQADGLYEAGCDDGSILTRNGVTSIQFDRQAESLEQAIRTAIADVESAGLDVARIEIVRKDLSAQAS